MEKSLTYASLADLLQNYVACYMRWWHTVLRIRIGLPIPHDVMYDGQVIFFDRLQNANVYVHATLMRI